MIFKPKLPLHFEETIKENGRAFIIVKPCGFCNEGFHCMVLLLLFTDIPFAHSTEVQC